MAQHGPAGLVTAVAVTPVAFPDPPLLNSVGVHRPWALRTVVQVHTSEGLVGIGETHGGDRMLGLLRAAAAQLVGLDPFDLNALEHAVGRAAGPSSAPGNPAPMVVAPFEVACFDLQGQSTGLPVHALLGGKTRATVSFAAYLFYKWGGHPGSEPDEWGEAIDADGVVRQARRMVDLHGFTSLKLKGGVFPPDDEVEAVGALRKAFPNHPIRLDPNGVWSVEQSIRVAEQTADLLEYLEDPTMGRDGMAAVAAAAPVPLATNMCVVSFSDVPEAVELGSIAVVLGDHHVWGGLRASQRLAAICDTFGWGLSMHSNSHLGVSLAAMVHLAAATPTLTYDCDTHAPWQTGFDILDEPLLFEGGAVAVPDGPGLGVTIDPDALARRHEDYKTCGLRERDDYGYIQDVGAGLVRPAFLP